MLQLIATIAISAIVTITSLIGAYNYLPMVNLADENTSDRLGTSITTIAGSDTLKDSRTVINNNFSALNAGKIEVGTTSVSSITTLPGLTTANALTSASALATVGTITSGTWSGTTITASKGGTGWTSMTANAILLGNGSSAIATTSAGTDGQQLTFSSSSAPYWSTAGINQAADYTWSGNNTHTATNTFSGVTVANNYIQVTASTTLSVNDFVLVSTVTGSLIKAFASTTNPGAGNDYGFLGVAKQGATNGSSIYVQIGGIVSGLSGLTPGAEYYISSSTAGAIVSTLGNAMFPIRVGRALSATTLLLERIKRTGYPISKTKGSNYTAETDGIANVITVNNGSCNITSNGIILSRVGSATYAYMNCTAPIYKGSVYTLNADADPSSVAYFTPIN